VAVVTGNAGANGQHGFLLGGIGNSAFIEVAELISYTNVLSAGEATDVFDELVSDYGITVP